MLKQDAMTPLYVQLMDTVEKDIKSGRYKPGDKIMTESEMAKTYGVSLITVRKAIGSLMEKGLVVRKQGKGTFVTKPKFSRNIKRLQSFSEMCEQMGVVPGAHMLENKIVDADEKIAARLGIETGSKVIFISRLRFADSEPVVIEKNYFPLKYAFLLEAQFEDNSLFDYLKEKAGMQVTSSEKLIELCRATQEEAKLLEVRKGDYLMFVRSTAYTGNSDSFCSYRFCIIDHFFAVCILTDHLRKTRIMSVYNNVYVFSNHNTQVCFCIDRFWCSEQYV